MLSIVVPNRQPSQQSRLEFGLALSAVDLQGRTIWMVAEILENPTSARPTFRVEEVKRSNRLQRIGEQPPPRYTRRSRSERINRRREHQQSPSTPSRPPATVVGSGTIVPVNWRLSNSVYSVSLEVPVPPVKKYRNARRFWLLARLGTARLTSCGLVVVPTIAGVPKVVHVPLRWCCTEPSR
jgi:hypothetical protein